MPIKAPYRTIIPAPPHTYRQTHSGEILMGTASGNRAGKPPEITLPVAAKPFDFCPAKIMGAGTLFIMVDEKGTSYSSAKKCDKNATTQKCMRNCYRAK